MAARLRASSSSASFAELISPPRDGADSSASCCGSGRTSATLPTRTPSPGPFRETYLPEMTMADKRTDDVYLRLKQMEKDVNDGRPFPVIATRASLIIDPEARCYASLIIASAAFARGLETEGFDAIVTAYDQLGLWIEQIDKSLAEIKDDKERAAAADEYRQKIKSFKEKLGSLFDAHEVK